MNKNADHGRPALSRVVKYASQYNSSASETQAAALARFGQPNRSRSSRDELHFGDKGNFGVKSDPLTQAYWRDKALPQARVRVTGAGFWEFDPTGKLAYILPVLDADGFYIDGVAWFPDQPRRWWLFDGMATFLGELTLERSKWRGTPLVLSETPADWACSKTETVCLLDWNVSLVSLLAGVSMIACNRRLQRRIETIAMRRTVNALPDFEDGG